MLKKLRSILSVLLTAVLVFLLAANLYTAYARKVKGEIQPRVLGYSSAVVVSGSMSGSIEVDDLVVTAASDSYAVGDIIMFRSGGSVVTHRIVEEKENGYITKGDANNAPDLEAVDPENIIGKVIFVIPKIGLLIGFLQTPSGLLGVGLLIVLLALLPGTLENKDKGGTRKDETSKQ